MQAAVRVSDQPLDRSVARILQKFQRLVFVQRGTALRIWIAKEKGDHVMRMERGAYPLPLHLFII